LLPLFKRFSVFSGRFPAFWGGFPAFFEAIHADRLNAWTFRIGIVGD
jgi:hypothetical protein